MSEEDQIKNSDSDEDRRPSDENIRFNLSISTDRDHFLRRTCPFCGRDFKTEIDQADIAWALSWQIRRYSLELGEEPASIVGATPPNNLRCPYCQHEAEGSDMHTEETIEYLKRFAYRDYVLPMINRMFSDLEDSLGGGSSGGGGFISISVSFTHERSPLPPRPIHGPEPVDMKIIDFLCCGNKIKVTDRWMDVRLCTYCGAQVALF